MSIENENVSNEKQSQPSLLDAVSSSVFDFETNFITCRCKTPILYPRHLGDGGYDWCKTCDCPLPAC